MLTNKKKTVKEKKSNDENVQAIRSWVRNIEQSTNSLSSRLNAIEKRISLGLDNTFKKSDPSFKIFEKSIQNVLSDLNENDYTEESINYIINAFEKKFSFIDDKVESSYAEMQIINEKINELNKSLDNNYEEIKKIRTTEIKILKDFKKRLEKIERRSPPTMKIGGTEIPIELSGIIAGSISIFAAFLVILNQQNFLISPFFLATIGLIFISSALFKSIRARSF